MDQYRMRRYPTKPEKLRIDHDLISACKLPGMIDGTICTITLESGFERFGAYETWGSGYVVEGKGVKAEHENLESAIRKWIRLVQENEEEN